MFKDRIEKRIFIVDAIWYLNLILFTVRFCILFLVILIVLFIVLFLVLFLVILIVLFFGVIIPCRRFGFLDRPDPH